MQRKEIPWVRVYNEKELVELERQLKELVRYNSWGEDRRDKNNKPISIVAHVYKSESGRDFKDCLLGVWFKSDELHKRGMDLIRRFKHEAM